MFSGYSCWIKWTKRAVPLLSLQFDSWWQLSLGWSYVRDSPSVIGSKASYAKQSLYISIDQTEKHLEASQKLIGKSQEIQIVISVIQLRVVAESCPDRCVHFHQGLIDDSHGPVSTYFNQDCKWEKSPEASPWTLSFLLSECVQS